MDEDTIQPQKNPPVDASDRGSEPDDSLASGQVFDITADLNISPIIDNEEQPVTNPSDPLPVQVPKTESPFPVEPKITPIPTQPSPSNLPQINPIPPAPTKAPAISAQSSAPLDSPDIKPIRTYESDVADLMSHKHTSTASIAIAESKKETGEEKPASHEPSHAVKDLLLVLFSLLLIAGGAFAAYYLYLQSALAPSAPTIGNANAGQQVLSALITSDFTTVLTIDGLSTNAIISKVQAVMTEPQPAGSIREIVPVVSQNGNEARVSASNMLKIMNIPAPNILVRSLNDAWMLGVYAGANGQKSVFVVAKNDFFQNSFAGMLQWENLMPDDLKQYLYPSSLTDIANTPPTAGNVQVVNPLGNLDSILSTTSGATTSSRTAAAIASTTRLTQASTTIATSSTTAKKPSTKKTPPASVVSTTTSTSSTTNIVTSNASANAPTNASALSFTLRGQFVNKIIANKDVREFTTTDGRLLFLYSFVDSATLVVASNESALSEILTRLEKQAYVR